ncbi:2-octaprenyl-6-methoxyphenyl hydroxylase [Shewanella waksmanii]|uniref:2-octaprenyl-6-methoxyphenyl hydroxylase n=1 Tax=Shewanella waksmanii TaxID=213783 RepID=UPI00048CEFE0|nr:2-octaprenyl-6-methoxyphenyl hydroxylase [Shewanella waksmanii]
MSHYTPEAAVSEQAVAQVDIAIVGGAMAGSTLALGLQQLSQSLGKPLKVALVEASAPNQHHPGFDARSIAISHGSIFELKRLGVWPHIAHLGTGIEHIHVSDRGHFGMTSLDVEDFHVDCFGEVVELAPVGAALFDQISKAEIELHCPAKLSQLDTHSDKQVLTLDNGSVIHAKLVVAADGVQSQVRQSVQQPITKVEFDQVAIVANVCVDTPHHGRAYERFTESGPIAVLPMSNSEGRSRISLVWALKSAEAERVLSLDDSGFLAELQQAFGHRAGRFTAVGKRVSYPLALSYMPRPIYHRTVFVGNAAQTLHPIAGQGFNLGLRDIATLLAEMQDYLQQDNDDVGSTELLHRYLSARESDRNSTINNVEFLVRGFSNNHWPLVAGRSLGLRLLSWLPPLKTPVARKAMGWKAPRKLTVN